MISSVQKLPRRAFLAGATSLTASVAFSQNIDFLGDVEHEASITNGSPRNISSFRMLDWRPYFKNLKNGAILSDIITAFMGRTIPARSGEDPPAGALVFTTNKLQNSFSLQR